MAKATVTIRQTINTKTEVQSYFAANQALFNRVAAFYFDVIQAHLGVLNLGNMDALRALEQLTHKTEINPNPVMSLADIQEDIPAMFRRAAINAALGSARSFYGNLARWQKSKAKSEAKGKKFKDRPPVPPRAWNPQRGHGKSATLYAGMRKERTDSSICIKVWTGTGFSWVRLHITGRDIPEGFETCSPQLVHRGEHWYLHTPIEKKLKNPLTIKKQIETNPDIKVCAIDLNLDGALAVCTIQDAEGSVLATNFIGSGQRAKGFRKRLLGRIARKRSQTGIIEQGVQDNADLWRKIRNYDDSLAHLVSCRIVQFVQEYGASVLVFEHLGNLKPEKGKYSKRGNQKRAFWMKGRIFKYAKYKAYNVGILTSRVNPRDTSCTCAKCGAPVARYNEGEKPEGYQMGAPLCKCTVCARNDNADRNASLQIGNKFFARYGLIFQEKPQTPLAIEREEQSSGVVPLQDAKVPTVSQLALWDGHESDNGHGTAQSSIPRLAGAARDSTEPLHGPGSRGYATYAQDRDYLGESEAAGF
jgi:IS605 OrfB family transposase